MSTHNKWGALSMRDRAFLIREAVRNGITDINSIRDTWEHRFDGESNNLSREDFYKQKQQEAIQAARLKQQSRTTHLSPIQAKTEEEKEMDKDVVKGIQDRIKERINSELPSYSAYKRLTFESFLGKAAAELRKRHSNGIADDLDYYTKRLKAAEEEASKCTKEGFGCIYQALDNYGKVETSNYKFMQFPEKYGFKSIPVEKILPGDLVQFTDGNGYPTHMLMAETPYNNTNENYEGEHMRYSGNAGHALRNNARYSAPWNSLRAYTFVGNKTDSLQWEKEYREKDGHQFSGEDNPKIQTDSEHKTDNSLIERIALNIGSRDSTKDEGRAGVRDIIMGTINALLGKQPTSNTNLAAFLGKPEEYGFEEITDNRGPQFHKRISQYEDQDIKTYKGVINPFNEYVVAQEDYDKFLELAKTGELFYGNADGDNTHSLYGIQDGRHYTIGSSPLHSGYRDDVQNYPIQFYTKEGKLYANAADFYDFNTDSWQGKMLTKKGKPYILRQNDIPVRSIYVPEDLLNLNPIYNVEEGLTDDIRRARNMHITVQNRENNK